MADATTAVLSLEDSTNPQFFLEKYCGYDFDGDTAYFGMEEGFWLVLPLLTTCLVFPAARDQHPFFADSDEILAAAGPVFNFFNKFVPMLTAGSQLISIVVASVGYYESYRGNGGFACFGLYTLALPLSTGVLIPVVKAFIKVQKDNMEKKSLLRTILNVVLPFLLAFVGLPGMGTLLKGVVSGIKGLFSCCSSCISCCGCDCLSMDFLKSIDVAAVLKVIARAIAWLWMCIAFVFMIGPWIVFIGNLIVVMVNGMVLSVVLGLITYIGNVLSVAATIKDGGVGGVAKAAAESWVGITKFDLSQSIQSMSLMSMMTLFSGSLSMSQLYWLDEDGVSYSSTWDDTMEVCKNSWAGVFAPAFEQWDAFSDTIGGSGADGFALTLSAAAALVHAVNETVVVTLLKRHFISKAREAALGAVKPGVSV